MVTGACCLSTDDILIFLARPAVIAAINTLHLPLYHGHVTVDLAPPFPRNESCWKLNWSTRGDVVELMPGDGKL